MLEQAAPEQSSQLAGERPSLCPFHHGELPSQKTNKDVEPVDRPIEQDADGVWHVRGYAEARAVLRSDGTRQAGFQAELLGKMPSYMNDPILFLEGSAHHEQRRQTARFFTPRTTDREYRGIMEETANGLIERFKRDGRIDLSDVTMTMAVRVAGQVVGLTDSRRPGMDKRISYFVEQEPVGMNWSLGNLVSFLRMQQALAKFYLLDVRPAIQARREQPREDVITHLIESGYRDSEIMTECITYGTAGMVTTREFISVATWHLLENPPLLERYLIGTEEERYAILHEILRLEPVVGHLFRRTEEDLTLESNGRTITIPAGDLIDLHIYAVNADEDVVGAEPLGLCPGRELADMRPRVPEYVMGFGDGHHRCPGAYIAIQESDIFLRRLLSLERLRIEREPELSWNETVKGYELRNFILALDAA